MRRYLQCVVHSIPQEDIKFFYNKFLFIFICVNTRIENVGLLSLYIYLLIYLLLQNIFRVKTCWGISLTVEVHVQVSGLPLEVRVEVLLLKFMLKWLVSLWKCVFKHLSPSSCGSSCWGIWYHCRSSCWSIWSHLEVRF